jgi:hypothetical protein
MAIENKPAQFIFDNEGLAGPPVFGWKKHNYDGGANLELHFSNLFDQDMDESGELVDHATGIPYDNSTYTGLEGLTIIEPDSDSEDVFGPILEDAA